MPENRTTTEEGLEEIFRPDLKSSAPAEAVITDVKHLASYNWINASAPTIAVPGCPPKWSPPPGRRQVRRDRGLVYISQNDARHPDSPLEPLFRSLYIEHPAFDIHSVDIVTDRNNIRKLLWFAEPALCKDFVRGAFTISVDMAAQTAIFSREGIATNTISRRSRTSGFGHEFEKAYTTAQVKDSTGHHRIISYKLGGLNFLVRHETDGYVEDLKTKAKGRKSTEASLSVDVDTLTLETDSTSMHAPSNKSKLIIKKEGRVTPRASTLEIKTRASHNRLHFAAVAAQLWASQTPKLVSAYHENGRFSTPSVTDVATAIQDWEKKHQDSIAKFVALINHILRVTRSWGGSSTISFDPLKNSIVITKIGRKKLLPDDLYARWETTDPANITQSTALHT